jgi:hypothetical protein
MDTKALSIQNIRSEKGGAPLLHGLIGWAGSRLLLDRFLLLCMSMVKNLCLALSCYRLVTGTKNAMFRKLVIEKAGAR